MKAVRIEDFTDGFTARQYRIPVSLLKPTEDLSKKETPKNIDDYPLIVYGNGEIQDGHHRYLYMIQNNQEYANVILASDIQDDDSLNVDESELIEGFMQW